MITRNTRQKFGIKNIERVHTWSANNCKILEGKKKFALSMKNIFEKKERKNFKKITL